MISRRRINGVAVDCAQTKLVVFVFRLEGLYHKNVCANLRLLARRLVQWVLFSFFLEEICASESVTEALDGALHPWSQNGH